MTSYITGLAGGGTGYFVDNNGQPKLLLADNPWALIPNAGRWAGSGGGATWQADIDNYCDSRGAQGFTAVYTDPLGNTTNNGAFADGRTFDGVYPFTANGTPGDITSSGQTVALNSTFWARVDYFVAGCARNGMTAWLNICYTEGTTGDLGGAGTAFGSFSNAQLTTYGTALATRYASSPNIIWTVGNDYFGGTGGSPGGNDAQFGAILTGLGNGGDTHLFTVHNNPETDSRFDFGTGTAGTSQTFGGAHAQFSMVYTYIQTYYGVEYAYGEASPVPVIWGDGYFYQSSGASYFAAFDRGMRQFAWWALSSGARGIDTGSEGIWQWTSSSPGEVTNEWWYVNSAGKIRAAVEALPNWHKLIPDTSSALVTAGRGTHCSSTTSGGGGTQYGTATTDAYVTASRAPDGSLALIYLSHATTITIDQTKMQAGYKAVWIDPVNGTTYAGTAGSTYNSGATDGLKPVSNSQGDPDWALALAGPSAAPPAGSLMRSQSWTRLVG